ncbi:Cell division protein FtsI/penicillin-binding protein 2 [Gracilibacillus orientalis]|uniref:serine-type D-Ala-D-Ala carboxypeptidase n=1 Tax=Gracilibacillus orientalis TaxID=334253 RepID=A0A1I4J2K1_9BACI|nr:penicillin-binding protein 2 [Gracilibacillus orientalis]SFL60423.1 Cell division protein FtsI/penicillin-binding protein 2 [Gracilibacillus orientalis]
MNQQSSLKKKGNKKITQLSLRLNLLFVFIFLLFSLLIVQIGVVQILNGKEAQQEIDQTENTPSEKAVPRGKMYDKNHNIILDNSPRKAITYTPTKNGESAEDRMKLAEKLAQYITIIKDEDDLKDEIVERDKKEYWYIENREEVAKRLTEKQKNLDSSDKYQAELDTITEDDLNEIDWTLDLLNIVAIKKELDAAYELSPHIVVNEGLTDEEYAQVSEHLHDLSGINAFIDWERERLYGDTLSSFVGNITSSEEGIPRENSEFYLANGYTWNDRVGTSGLEQQYEHVLRGRKEKIQYKTNSSQEVISSEVVVEGERGKDLILTVNMELQEKMDEIVEDELRKGINHPVNNNGYLEDALAVLMNPQTGEIITLSAIRYDRENQEYKNNAYRTIYDAHAPGSSIKGATVLAGYQEGAIDIGTYLDESPIKIQGSEEKSSYANLGSSLNDIQAIKRSSNAYMMRIALRISGATYRHNEILYNFNYDSFDTLRNYYSQFGLGAKTGIDFPYEATGVTGDPKDGGVYLDLSFGQYDTYTTLQLAQYVSTIANDGYRMRPRLVKEIREPGNENHDLGKVIESFAPEVLNKLKMDDKYIDRVQEGFWRVFNYPKGTANGEWGDFPYEVAGKTGTAQNPQSNDIPTHNLTLVGYSPVEKPEVAFAVVVPKNGTGNGQYPIHHSIGKRAIKAYYDYKNGNEQEDEEE